MAQEEVAERRLLEAGLSQEEIEVLNKVLESVRQIKYGSVQLTIQDGRVVQIDRMEKQRLTYK